MLKLQKYIEVSGESRRNVFLKLADGRLLRKLIDGDLYIIQPTEIASLNEKQKQMILEDKKKEWNSRIAFATQNEDLKSEIIQEIIEDVSGYEKLGFKIIGYNLKTLYRKIKSGKLNRVTRKDKGVYKNNILANPHVQEKILEIAKPWYFKDARGSIRLTADRIQYIAKQREDLYEIAAIPFSTLYNFLNNNLPKESHECINHHDQWSQKRPYVSGAFTNDIDFMDWISLDDHMMQISGVNIYNEVTGKVELKTVYTWFAIESLTMNPVAYDFKFREFNGNDIKSLMMKALMNVGKPSKGFLFDNGLASSSSNLQMLNYLGINYRIAKPYTPTGKATMERFFGLLNSELTVFINNYIGNTRADGRHTSLKLSPEESLLTDKQLIECIDNYIQGFFIDRPRTRKIRNVTKRISVREYYEQEYTNYTPQFCDPRELRFAFMDGAIKKFDGQCINFGKHGLYVPAEALSPALSNRYYLCKYNPLDMNEIDIYTTEAFRFGDFLLDKDTYLTTLYSMDSKGNTEKQESSNKLRKQHRKYLKEAAQTTTELMILENPALGMVSSENKLVDTRKEVNAKVLNALYTETGRLQRAKLTSQSVTQIEPETELTYETDEESKLNFEEEN